jgi:diguanylate cyclase (GGDEF)-like protein
MGTQDDVERLITSLKDVIERAVRFEQLKDSLTGLPNGLALDEQLNAKLKDAKPFWVAFVEVDHFKKINQKFSYDIANELLRAIARQLQQSCAGYFTPAAEAYRAHGDEFFVLGQFPEEATAEHVVALCQGIHESLDNTRVALSALRIKPEAAAEVMSCTVSVGWLCSLDFDGATPGVHQLKELLDRAVSVAKRCGRNQVIRYGSDLLDLALVDHRSSCAECRANFTVDYEVQRAASGDLYCPNCGSRQERPKPPPQAPSPKRI